VENELGGENTLPGEEHLLPLIVGYRRDFVYGAVTHRYTPYSMKVMKPAPTRLEARVATVPLCVAAWVSPEKMVFGPGDCPLSRMRMRYRKSAGRNRVPARPLAGHRGDRAPRTR